MKQSNFLSQGSFGFVVTLLAAFFMFSTLSCEMKPPKNSRLAQGERGKVHFQKYCVSCHGEDGKGIVIDSLATQPADLTQLRASTGNNQFPIAYVAKMIDGRQIVKAHGARDMPVWGDIFRAEGDLDETQVKGKLAEIIAYLMSIQD